MAARSVQDYIEDIPADSNGSARNGPVLSPTQWLVWSLATAGKFFEGLIVFMGGLALPLVSRQFGMTSAEKGLVTAATLLGILLGALWLGGLADRWGRKPVFIGEMVLLAVALLGAACSVNTPMLVLCLFVVGLALGADYPTAHLVISESIPAGIRGRLVLGAFSFQALGALVATLLAASFLTRESSLNLWRQLYLLPVVPVLLVVCGRLFLPESSHWLVSQGRRSQAEQHLRNLLHRDDIDLIVEHSRKLGPQQRRGAWRHAGVAGRCRPVAAPDPDGLPALPPRRRNAGQRPSGAGAKASPFSGCSGSLSRRTRSSACSSAAWHWRYRPTPRS